MKYSNPNEMWRTDPFRKLEESGRVAKMICHIGMMAIAIFAIVVLCGMCCSCTTTKYVTVPEYHTDTLIVNKVQKDSIWVHDSVSVREKGDTVWIEKWHTKYAMKEVHDTTYIHKTDSMPMPYPVETIKEVEKPLKWWQETLMWAGVLLFGFLGVWLFLKLK